MQNNKFNVLARIIIESNLLGESKFELIDFVRDLEKHYINNKALKGDD